MAIMACQLTVLFCEHDKKILQPCFDPQLCSYVRVGRKEEREKREERSPRVRDPEEREIVRGEGSAQN